VKRANPDHVVVSYINTSAGRKAESDIICTSRNAVDVVNSIPADKPILFLPDINLGNWVSETLAGRTSRSGRAPASFTQRFRRDV
jgi:quinolinate synthase